MDAEKLWFDMFGGYGTEFEKARPNYQALDKTTQTIGALMKLELDMHNGGFLQFFCNWGYEAYLLALEGLENLAAMQAKGILQQAYSVIERYENDSRLQQLWDITAVLSEEEINELDRLDQIYWSDKDAIMEKMLAAFK